MTILGYIIIGIALMLFGFFIYVTNDWRKCPKGGYHKWQYKEDYYQCIDITGKKDSTKNNYPSRICKPGNYFNSPTEAYENAIEYTIKNLIP